MWINRNPDWSLNITKCLWYCQSQSTKICWKWCRNKKTLSDIDNEVFFSSININKYSNVFETEKYYKNKVEEILKDIY